MKFPFVWRSRFEREIAELRSALKTAREQTRLAKNSAKEWRQKEKAMAALRARECGHFQAQSESLGWSHSRVLEELVEAKKAWHQSRKGGSPAAHQRSGSAGPPIPLVIGIDVEPDRREVDLADPSWRGTEAFFGRLPGLLERLRKIAGVEEIPLTWFLRADPQVETSNGRSNWAFHHFAPEWREAIQRGDEIGLHVHPWRWEADAGTWTADHENADWISHCVGMGIEGFRNFFGVPPTSYRGGDRFLSNPVCRQLEEAGVQVDLTVERMPAMERLVSYERGTGWIPEGLSAPSHAYWPSDEDYRRPGPARTSGFGIFPLTSYPGGTLIPWMTHTDFRNGLEWNLIDRSQMTHLAFVVRSDITISSRWDDFCLNLEALSRKVREDGLVFAPATQAWRGGASILGGLKRSPWISERAWCQKPFPGWNQDSPSFMT